MEPVLLIAAAAGALAGFAAGALPGMHVNGLAALALALAPRAGAPGQVFLVAALAASPFGAALPATFLGASGEDSALAALPAHALAREGRGVEAVALQAWGAFAGLLVAIPVAAAARLLFAWLGPKVAAWSPWLALAILAALVLTEPARPKVHRRALPTPVRERGRWVEHERTEGPLSPWAGRALALLVVLLAGALGWAALRLGAGSPFGLPGSALLPLLAGLFAAPELLAAARTRTRGPRAAQAMESPVAWLGGAPPQGVLTEAGIVIAAAAAACLLARLAARPLARLVARTGPARWGLAGLALLVAASVAFCGWIGLADLGAATLVGFVPRRLGVRRSLGMAAILLPIAIRAWAGGG